MKYCLLLIINLFALVSVNAQDTISIERKIRFPGWITHSKNVDIIGVSFAALPKGVLKNDTTLTRTYGLRIEPSIFGFFSPLIPRSPVSTSEESYLQKQNEALTEIINGINLSSGTFGETKVNGISGGFFLQYLYHMNGIAFSGMGNLIEKHNGIGLSVLGNDAFKSNGLLIGLGNSTSHFNGIQIGGRNIILNKGIGIQIGIFNQAKNFKGIQLGVWNENEKRKLPFINWNFK